MSSCDCSDDNAQGVELPADEVFRALRVLTDFYKHRQEFHNLLRGASDFTNHSSVLGAGVRYAGDDKALAFGTGSNHPSEINVTEHMAFSMFWTDPECTIPRLAFQISGARPTHTAAKGKLASGPAPQHLFLGIELDKNMQTARLREVRINGKAVTPNQNTFRRILNAVAMAADELQANGRLHFNDHLQSTLPARDVKQVRARMARRKFTP